jgi:hypothetical protein
LKSRFSIIESINNFGYCYTLWVDEFSALMLTNQTTFLIHNLKAFMETIGLLVKYQNDLKRDVIQQPHASANGIAQQVGTLE